MTGGFDSRVLAGCLHNQGITPECVTYGHRHCHDVRYGRRIAKVIGATHEYLPLADDFFKLDLDWACTFAAARSRSTRCRCSD